MLMLFTISLNKQWINSPRHCVLQFSSVQFSCSVVSDSFDPMDCSMPGLPVHHRILAFTQTHVH